MPDPLFILASPRSYTSLVGGMLGQHPQTYGLPEVNLVVRGQPDGGTLAMRGKPPDLGTAGLLRVLAQLEEGEQTEEAVQRAQTWIERHGDWTGKQVFAHIQKKVGADKMLIDKSPQNVVLGAVLGGQLRGNLPQLFDMFPSAHFLHLVRHPRAASKSSVAIRTEYDVTGTFARRRQGRDDAYRPEAVWAMAQRNVEVFFQDLPPGRFARIRGEDLLRSPRLYLRQICEWIGLDTGEAAMDAMLHPENGPYASVGPPSAQYGADPKFLKNPKIDFDRLAAIAEPSLDGDLEWGTGSFGPEVIKLARSYGYQ